ncbi:MAG: DUF3343 domain-containing protein [Phycisphaerae bacterium]|nr:DUF3343 domain-containing protein [Phycisphaerae bacterium]
MSNDRYYVLILPSVHFVLKLEKEALAQGIPVELIPTPRQISSDCGMTIKFYEESLDWLFGMMAQSSMPAGRLYRRKGNAFDYLGLTGKSGNRP